MRNSSSSPENGGSGSRDEPADKLPWRSGQIGAE
jgi:hypothetical protein